MPAVRTFSFYAGIAVFFNFLLQVSRASLFVYDSSSPMLHVCCLAFSFDRKWVGHSLITLYYLDGMGGKGGIKWKIYMPWRKYMFLCFHV